MARKQAKRRKQKKAPKLTMPKIHIGRIVAPLVAVGIVVATYHLTIVMLDRTISSIEISGPFQRVTALQIEEAISDEIEEGFIGSDLDRIQAQIVAMPWIDQARVARRWPSSRCAVGVVPLGVFVRAVRRALCFVRRRVWCLSCECAYL